MSQSFSRALFGVFGCILVGFACWFTQSATPLWALILVGLLMDTI